MMGKVRITVAALFAAATLAGAAPAVAHDGSSDNDPRAYCGASDGGFLTVHGGFGGVTFDRFTGRQRWVTPGAPDPENKPTWHLLIREYAHFYFGYRYTDERSCGWWFF